VHCLVSNIHSANTVAMSQCHIPEDLNSKLSFLPKIGSPV